MITIYKIFSGYSSYNLPIVSVSNQNYYRSVNQQSKITGTMIKKMPIPLNEKVLRKAALMGQFWIDFESGEVGLVD